MKVALHVFAAVVGWLICTNISLAQIVDLNATCGGNSGQTLYNICYNGGNIVRQPVNAYVIYYGNWGTTTQNIINNWLSTLGGTGLFGINSAYHDFSGAGVQNVLNYNASINSYHDYQNPGDDYQTMGTVLFGDAAVQAIIADVITAGHLPADTNGVYFVLTAWNVTQVDSTFGSFCAAYIGYHNNFTMMVAGSSYILKYALIGNPLQCPYYYDGNLLKGDTTTPNGSIGADGSINIMFHELSETVTDPWIGSWGDTLPVVNEVGDLCEWEFGTWSKLPVASNGAHYNVTIAGVNYLIQRLFQVFYTGIPVPHNYYSGTCVIGNMAVASSPNPSLVAQPVSFTASVATLGTTTPTGNVTFYFGNGGPPLCSATLSGGQASCSFTFQHPKNPAYVYAYYAGDSNYDPSTSPMLTQIVSQ